MKFWRWAVVVALAVAIAAATACVGDSPDSTGGTDAGNGGDVTGQGSDSGPGGQDGGADVDAAPRCNANASFGDLVAIPQLAAPDNASDEAPFLSDDEQQIWFISNRN